MGVEELDPADGDDQRTGSESFLVLEIQEVRAQLLLGESIGGLMEVVGQLPDGSEVGLLGAFAEPGQLEILVHLLTKRGDHKWGLSRRKGRETVWNPL
jgi:hypothetical protein